MSLLRTAILAAVLLCAQALALDHEIGHGFGGEPEACATCSVGGNLKHAAASTDTPPPAPAVQRTFNQSVHATAPTRTRTPRTARAPPAYS